MISCSLLEDLFGVLHARLAGDALGQQGVAENATSIVVRLDTGGGKVARGECRLPPRGSARTGWGLGR